MAHVTALSGVSGGAALSGGASTKRVALGTCWGQLAGRCHSAKSCTLTTSTMGRILKACSHTSHHLRQLSSAPALTISDCCTRPGAKELTKTPKPYMQIPGPRQLPILGNSWRFLPIIGQYRLGELDRAMVALHKQYGRMARLGGLLGHPDLLFVYDADLVEQVFRAEDALAGQPCRPPMPSIAYYKRTLRADFFGDTPGVIGIHGPLWHAFRTQVNKVMLSANAAKNFTADLDAVSADFVNRVHAMLDENNEVPHDFLDELYKWSLESLGAAALGTRLGCLSSPEEDADADNTQRLLSAVRDFFATVAVVELRKPYSRWLNTVDWRRYVAALDVFREECMRRVADAVADDGDSEGRATTPLLRQVLERTGNPRLTAALAMDLMLVGLDTSSVSTATSLYLLARNADAQERLFAELRRLMPRPDSPLDVATTDQMHYLRACIREALRIYPVIIGNGRCLSKDTVIGGYLVPKGVHVIFGHLVTGNDAAHGFPEPHRFAPERWLHDRTTAAGSQQDSESRSRSSSACPASTRPHPFGAVPFGFGRRMCLGRRLAEHQLLLLLARLVRRYRVEHHHADFEYEVTPVYAPRNALRFRLLERPE